MQQPIAQQLLHARHLLAPVAGANAPLEVRVLAAHVWNLSIEDLLRKDHESRDAEPFLHALGRRMRAEPVAQILGYKDFWRDRFTVSADVLTPRADSETMIETLLRLRADKNASLRVLDLGTGSGCLLLSALREYPNARGVGADQSAAALAIASQNAAALEMHDRATFTCSNWCSNLGDATFDVVLANPPYIPTRTIATLDADVRGFEPHAALDGGADGLECYRSIVQQLPQYLAPGALVLFEVGQGQDDAVAALAEPNFLLNQMVPDLAGIMRVVALEYQPNQQ